jgi:hypothetical protein
VILFPLIKKKSKYFILLPDSYHFILLGFVNQIGLNKDTIETLTGSIADNEEILQQAKIDLRQAN